MAVLGEKLGDGPMDHSAGLGVVSGALFLRSSRVYLMLFMAYERLPRTWTARRKRTWAYMDWHGNRTYRVYRVFPCRVYINLNCRDSRI
jgi:hypothetical protein